MSTSRTKPSRHVAIVIDKRGVLDLLTRLEAAAVPALQGELVADSGPRPDAVSTVPVTPMSSIEDRWNAAVGCKTVEVGLELLAQIVALDNFDPTTAAKCDVDTALFKATAMLAELEPKTATEALLAAQMVGTQRQAMRFLKQATVEGQTVMGADANVLRATRLMRLFNEQVDTMAKLKGKSGQQRVVVEHVTVAAGGQAVVGVVTQGGRGSAGDSRG